MEVDGEEEESERRNNAIEIYMLDVNIRNSLQEEIELGEEYLETLKEILEANEEELRLIYLITSRVELVGEIVKPLEKDRSCFWNKSYMGDSQLLVREMFKYARDHQVKVIMATNRPDVLDPALLRPGRIDNKIEIPLPNQDSRLRILKIHASGITKQGEIDYERVAKLSEGFNGAYICTEAAMLAIPADRDYVVPNDFIKAVRKLESSAHSTINA